MRRAAIVILLILGFSGTGTAQRLRGRLLDESSGGPISGAIVALVDASGAQAATDVTRRSGVFHLAAPAPGAYVVRVLRIGFEEWESEPLDLAAAGTSLDFRVPTRAVLLAGIVAEGRSECRVRPEAGLATGTLWSEARKALRVAAWTDGAGDWRFRSRVYQRDSDRQGEVQAEQDSTFWTTSTSPFRARPAWLLAEDGFVVRDGRNARFFAPDADVLLSEEFLEGHCYRAVRGTGDEEGLLGLEFEPIRDRDASDVTGALWLDAGTNELRYVTYTYVNIPPELRGDELGGRVEFERIQDGGWIVRRWWIRMPRTEMRTVGTRLNRSEMPQLLGYRDAGGEVVAVASGSITARERPARIIGVVFDSTSNRPVRGARVVVEGTEYSAVTEGTGRYVIEAPLEGEFSVRLLSGRADSLGYVPDSRTVTVRPGGVRPANFSIPSWSGIVERWCGEDVPEALIVVGVVRSPDGSPLPGARVRVSWEESRDGSPPRLRRESTVAGRNGVYGLCDIADGTATDLVALYGVDRSSVVSVRRVGDDLTWRGDLLPGRGATRTVDLIVTDRDVQHAQIRGTVVDQASGAPVPAAIVELPVLGLQTQSDAQGQFAFEALPAGDLRVLVRHQRYHAGSAYVGVEAGDSGLVASPALALQPAATQLPELVATAAAPRARRLESVGFFDRRAADQGEFLARDEFMTFEPLSVTDVLRRVPGIRIGLRMPRNTAPGATTSNLGSVLQQRQPIESVRVDNRSESIQMRGGCEPVVYLDGAPINPDVGVDVDQILSITDVEAIEVYSSSAQVPPVFNVTNSGCGVIVIWSR